MTDCCFPAEPLGRFFSSSGCPFPRGLVGELLWPNSKRGGGSRQGGKRALTSTSLGPSVYTSLGMPASYSLSPLKPLLRLFSLFLNYFSALRPQRSVSGSCICLRSRLSSRLLRPSPALSFTPLLSAHSQWRDPAETERLARTGLFRLVIDVPESTASEQPVRGRSRRRGEEYGAPSLLPLPPPPL